VAFFVILPMGEINPLGIRPEEDNFLQKFEALKIFIYLRP
jgi:hypothetical protein